MEERRPRGRGPGRSVMLTDGRLRLSWAAIFLFADLFAHMESAIVPKGKDQTAVWFHPVAL